MKQNKKISPEKIPVKSSFSRYYLLAGIVIVVIVIAAVLFTVLQPASKPGAGALYDKSVDLANAGKYQEALDAADQALALNDTMYTALLQSDRAGILVMLGRNREAIDAADAALAVKGNLTTSYSIAWFNKGNALRNLGSIDEARAAYANATKLDPSLVPPQI